MTESGPSAYARGVIGSLRLSPHPEGGWYRRTWQSDIAANTDHAAAVGADMKCVNLLEQVDDGQIWLGDTDITDPRINQDKSRSRIGVVFQQFNLFPHMTVLNNVTLAVRKVHKWDRTRAEEKAMTEYPAL